MRWVDMTKIMNAIFSVEKVIKNNKKIKFYKVCGKKVLTKTKKIKVKNITNNSNNFLQVQKMLDEVMNKTFSDKLDINHLDIAFIIPAPVKGGGGHRNLFRAIKYLKDFGHKLTVYYTMSEEDAYSVKKNSSEWFYDMSDIPFVRFEGQLGFHDVGVCSFWTTAQDLKSQIDKVKYPFYFVQDFEPMFYEMGTGYILAENTYKFGFSCICSGPWCKDFLINKYHAEADYFQFPVDYDIYNNSKPRTKKNKNIIFFAKPEMPRRCYDIGIQALKHFNELCPEVEIITFGSNKIDERTIPFKVTHLGLLPTINDLADLYRNADFGLVFSTTNPSLVPYEMMSCGCPVGDLDVELALSKYGNSQDNVFLLNPLPEKMGEELAEIFKHPKEIKKRAESGKMFVKNEFPTELEMAKIVERIIKDKVSSSDSKNN